METHDYILSIKANRMLITSSRFSFIFKFLSIFIFLSTFPIIKIKAQGHTIVYDVIPVNVIVEGFGSFYVDVVYTENNQLYINVEDLFKTLKISCISGQKGDSLGGFIENEKRPYVIDFNKGTIKVGDKIFNPKDGIIKETGLLFIESSLIAEAFGLSLTFNYRALTIIFKSNFELPVIKLQRIEKMRNSISKLKGETTADTVMKRNYHLIRFGVLDWSLSSFQTYNELTENRLGLGLGTEFFYGEADITAIINNKYQFDKRQLQYLWHWVDNNRSIIKQAELGKISTQSISYLNAPVIGAVIRNAPTTIRKAKGYYTINEYTDPNWTVELYINNVMVDYTRADASGLFVFNVPIVYGYTTLKLKFYGPLGEERTDERTMNVPYTVMPVNEFEYGLSLGLLQDNSYNRFGKGDFNYGLNRFLTIGGGLEYLSSIPNHTFIPYFDLTFQPYSKLTLNGEYDHGVKSKALLNYYFTKSVLLEIDYTKFVEGQLAIPFTVPEELKVKLSIPWRYYKFSGFVKSEFTQSMYKFFNYNQENIILSSYYKLFSANLSTQLNWINKETASVISDLALSYRLKNGYTLRPSIQFNVADKSINTLRFALEKNIPKAYFSLIYERNVLSKENMINITFKYDLSFVKTTIASSYINNRVSSSEEVQGSLAFGSGNKEIYKSNVSSISKGGISVYPFLDLNNNGIMDEGEHLVKINTLRITGGKVNNNNNKDSIILISDLIAFTNYNLEFSDNNLDNIAWRFKNKTYSVLVDPNQYKRINVPVIAIGEVNGMVSINSDNSIKGIGRILIDFYNKNGTKVITNTLSESDGYINYIGLEPGDYIARVDSTQLNNLDLTAEPLQRTFTIKTLEEGDIVSGIDFILTKKSKVPKALEEINSIK